MLTTKATSLDHPVEDLTAVISVARSLVIVASALEASEADDPVENPAEAAAMRVVHQ